MHPTEDSEISKEEKPEEPLYEETDPDFEDANGALKTDNPEGNRWQRRFVRVAAKESKFRKTVETALVVHGWKTPARTEPMSLVILSVKLICHARNFRFQSARMSFEFDEDTEGNLPNAEEATPEVVAYAPFVAPQDWHPSQEDIEKTTTAGGTLGLDMHVKAEAEYKKDVKRSHTRTHFDRGSADWMVDKDKPYGVTWYFEQNDLEKYGVKPHFHLAVLIKRQHSKADGKPIPFKGVFDLRVEAGFIHDFNEGRRRMFRQGKPEDEAIYYDPNMEDQIHGLNSHGEKLRAKIKKDHLGELMEGPDGNWLSALIDPTGSLSGLEPMYAIVD